MSGLGSMSHSDPPGRKTCGLASTGLREAGRLSQEAGTVGADLCGQYLLQRSVLPQGRRRVPVAQLHVQSTVKLFNRRVKGTEEFWGATGGEVILQLWTAFLSEHARSA